MRLRRSCRLTRARQTRGAEPEAGRDRPSKQWPLDHMQQMMKEHLDLTLAEAVAHLTANYPADVAAYDRVHTAILSMADMLSLGIINQFPKRFR